MEGSAVLERSLRNLSCEEYYVPSATEHLESLGAFGIGLLSVGTALTILTIYFAVDACCNVFRQKDSTDYKSNVIMILSLYPLISIFCLTALGVPRSQVLSDTAIQLFLMIVLYRVYLMAIDVGHRKVTKPPEMVLKVAPCCCLGFLPFAPNELTLSNLSRLKVLVLQLPIVQGILNVFFLFVSIEEPGSQETYKLFLEPFGVVSIFLGVYGLNVAVRSMEKVVPDAKLRRKALVSQLLVLFSKLQSAILKKIGESGLFPCNPPISPEIYAYVTYNALMVIETLLLCYIARHFYYVDLESEERSGAQPTTDRTRDNVEAGDLTNNNDTSKRTILA